MSWRGSRESARRRFVERYDAAEADGYDALVGTLEAEDEAAYLADLDPAVVFEPGMRVLDAGAGTGTMCQLLARRGDLSITALEPAPAMLERLKARPGLERVVAVEGFCDAPGDRTYFSEASFDIVISRQLCNCLFDPLAAFENWRHWLAREGAAVVIDGLYDRDSWSGKWEEEVDALPLSSCRTMALVLYLLERAGFEVEHVGPMARTNERPTARTRRYCVVARKPQ